MTSYVLVADNGSTIYPMQAYQLRQQFPNVSFPAGLDLASVGDELLAELGVFPVEAISPPPYVIETQDRVELSPVADTDGNWRTQWSVVNLTEEQVEARRIAMLPPPDYIGFQQAALTTPEFQAMIAAAFPSEPLACMSLATLLVQAAQGQSTAPLITAMGQVVAAAEPSEAHLLQFISAAEYFHLPEMLIDDLLRAHLPEPA